MWKVTLENEGDVTTRVDEDITLALVCAISHGSEHTLAYDVFRLCAEAFERGEFDVGEEAAVRKMLGKVELPKCMAKDYPWLFEKERSGTT